MRRLRPAPLTVLAAITALAVLAPLRVGADELAADLDAAEQVYAVQQKPLQRRHEFSASVGVLPLDALYKGITLGVGYTYHFDPLWAWQIAHFRYSFNVNTTVEADLKTRFDTMPARLPPVEYLLDSTVMLKLFSGKAVLGQRTLAGAEVALLLGPALGILSSSSLSVGFNAGLGLRAHLNRWFTANLELRQYELFMAQSSKGVNHVLDVSIGASLNLR